MENALSAGPNLPFELWRELRARAIFDYCKWDHQCEDNSVLARFPLFVGSRVVDSLGAMAEGLSEEAFLAEAEILRRPELIRRLGISKRIAEIMERSRGRSAGSESVRVMRFDFHFTSEGWRISEANADVPGGYVEASGWNQLLSRQFPDTTPPPNPTEEYVRAIQKQVRPYSLIALAHATVYSDDRQTMVHFAKEMVRSRLRPCLISASHLHWEDGRAALKSGFADGRPELVVRFLPAEWLPQMVGAGMWEPWFLGSKTPLSNPACAILLQSKRFPLTWNELDSKLPSWRRLLPESCDPSQIKPLNTSEWVLKPAFGRVGESVGIRGVTGEREYAEIQRAVKKQPENWIAQRRFEIVPVETEEGLKYPCIGVYTVNGKMAGLYARVGPTPLINETAQDAGILICEGKKESKQ